MIYFSAISILSLLVTVVSENFIYIYIYREWMWSSGLGRWT
jgi:hypothetical protein